MRRPSLSKSYNPWFRRARATVVEQHERSLPTRPCAFCKQGAGNHLYGFDPDGFVLCKRCLSPLFYCDIGGQG